MAGLMKFFRSRYGDVILFQKQVISNFDTRFPCIDYTKSMKMLDEIQESSNYHYNKVMKAQMEIVF